LPLKAARRDAIANLKCFGGPGTPSTQFRWLHLHSLCGATLFGSHQLLSKAVADCLYRLSFRDTRHIVEKPNKCKSFSAQTPKFARQIVSAIYCRPFGYVCWVPFADLCLRNLTMK